ncbi:DUF3667 domain-containing protein [Stakelama tenebrarum]|uniref:DUF3667 domain-containing protein n=1 Tax=Stakelama tenebrarum TaxID=2711215 RepID=A0A6G6Y1H6_9SPHN|nr:DUF3667 domain-containing protein [Sphingosinithalassobacter tenebrarum]QIG78463.1 DUF3667 domain-containing protein [Sphingosinithalassobacter tenebrarum]
MGEFEGGGEIVTGALIGRAVEPHAGEPGGEGSMCLNCGTALIGAHCHRCGQGAHVHRSIGEIWHEILHGVVHFDGKLWRTLPMLVFRPGELTRRYIEGERARFVSPMALFLFALFTMFAVFQIAGISPPTDLKGNGEVSANLTETREKLEDSRAEAVQVRDSTAPGSPEHQAALRQIVEADEGEEALKRVAVIADPTGGHENEIHTGWERLDHGLEKWSKNPGLMLYKLQSNGYKFSWLLIPLSLPFVWLMFAWKRGYGGYDHAVFITYSIAFMSMLFIALTLVAGLGVPMRWLALASLIIPPLHIYKHLKGAYRLRRLSALARTLLLLVFIQIVIILFTIVLVFLGLVG